jgi:transposase
VVDALGNPVKFLLTGGQVADVTQGPTLLAELRGIGAVLADKAYDAQAVLEVVEQCGAQAVIPPKISRLIQRSYDRYLYRARADIECFFQRLKQFRRLATRYEKLAQHFQAFLALATTVIWLL